MHSAIIRSFCLVSLLALGLPSSANAAATLNILVSKLTVPPSRMAINIDGPSPTGTFVRDTEFVFSDGTYEVVLRGGQAIYGTFTLSGGAVVNTTGTLALALVLVPGSPDAIDFNLSALARVEMLGSELSIEDGIPAARNTTQIPEAAGTFPGDSVLYFPPTRDGFSLDVSDRGVHGYYGQFIVNAALEVEIIPGRPTSAEALVLTVVNTISFDRSKLAEVRILASALSVPADLSTINLPETAGTFKGDGFTVFLPPSLNPTGYPFSVTDRGGHGVFGAFSIDSSLVVSLVGGGPASAESLVLTPVTPSLGGTTTELSFDTNRLGEVRLLISALSTPTPSRILVQIAESVGNTTSDLLAYLPPNRLPSLLPYRVIPRGNQGLYGTFVINPDLSVVPDLAGSLRTTPDGLAFYPCVLNQLLVEPAADNQVALSEVGGGGSAPLTLTLPNGTYRARLSNGNTVEETLVLSTTPGASVLTTTPRATFTLLDCGPGDLDGNGDVDQDDLDIVVNCFGQSAADNPNCALADVNGDGVVNILDISFVASHFTP